MRMAKGTVAVIILLGWAFCLGAAIVEDAKPTAPIPTSTPKVNLTFTTEPNSLEWFKGGSDELEEYSDEWEEISSTTNEVHTERVTEIVHSTGLHSSTKVEEAIILSTTTKIPQNVADLSKSFNSEIESSALPLSNVPRAEEFSEELVTETVTPLTDISKAEKAVGNTTSSTNLDNERKKSPTTAAPKPAEIVEDDVEATTFEIMKFSSPDPAVVPTTTTSKANAALKSSNISEASTDQYTATEAATMLKSAGASGDRSLETTPGPKKSPNTTSTVIEDEIRFVGPEIEEEAKTQSSTISTTSTPIAEEVIRLATIKPEILSGSTPQSNTPSDETSMPFINLPANMTVDIVGPKSEDDLSLESTTLPPVVLRTTTTTEPPLVSLVGFNNTLPSSPTINEIVFGSMQITTSSQPKDLPSKGSPLTLHDTSGVTPQMLDKAAPIITTPIPQPTPTIVEPEMESNLIPDVGPETLPKIDASNTFGLKSNFILNTAEINTPNLITVEMEEIPLQFNKIDKNTNELIPSPYMAQEAQLESNVVPDTMAELTQNTATQPDVNVLSTISIHGMSHIKKETTPTATPQHITESSPQSTTTSSNLPENARFSTNESIPEKSSEISEGEPNTSPKMLSTVRASRIITDEARNNVADDDSDLNTPMQEKTMPKIISKNNTRKTAEKTLQISTESTIKGLEDTTSAMRSTQETMQEVTPSAKAVEVKEVKVKTISPNTKSESKTETTELTSDRTPVKNITLSNKEMELEIITPPALIESSSIASSATPTDIMANAVPRQESHSTPGIHFDITTLASPPSLPSRSVPAEASTITVTSPVPPPVITVSWIPTTTLLPSITTFGPVKRKLRKRKWKLDKNGNLIKRRRRRRKKTTTTTSTTTQMPIELINDTSNFDVAVLKLKSGASEVDINRKNAVL